jgi:hypothetical protein
MCVPVFKRCRKYQTVDCDSGFAAVDFQESTTRQIRLTLHSMPTFTRKFFLYNRPCLPTKICGFEMHATGSRLVQLLDQAWEGICNATNSSSCL